jgi:hypothetical protein
MVLSGDSAHHEHETPVLLERDVGGSGDEVLAVSAGDARKRLHAARRDDHSARPEGSAGDRRALLS